MLQLTTGLLISGSTALSFFTRELFRDGSDLDLYIDYPLTLQIVFFLSSCGYKYEPFCSETMNQPDRIEDAVEEMDLRLRGDGFAALNGDEVYMGKGVAGVFTFMKADRKRR